MRDVVSIPRVVLGLLVSSCCIAPIAAAEKPWPYNLPRDQKYYPEHEALVKRNLEIEKRLATQAPVGVRKMSNDPGEMFFLDYWQFEDDETSNQSEEQDTTPAIQARWPSPPLDTIDNTTLVADFLPPFLLHTDDRLPSTSRFLPRNVNIFDKRDFQCPTGTGACSSISRPNSCCSTDETCVIIPDTGLGDVGCCPKGRTCGGSVATCQVDKGFSSCPGSSNGGCCIPDYSCEGVGCVKTGYATTTAPGPVVTVTVTPGATTLTSTQAPPPPASVVTVTQTVISGNTVLITSTPAAASTRTVYTTLPVNTTVVVVQASAAASCSSGFNSCAASLGGGCCPTDRLCGSSGLCPARSTSTATDVAPAVRPTGDAVDTTTTTTSAPPTSLQICPTGYYMCSARYIGGCCQVGRNCESTSCPLTSSTTVLASGETVVVPVGSADASVAGGVPATTTVSAPTQTQTQTTTQALAAGQLYCANGWYGCGADAGGGCCPSGYGCGQSCTKSAPGEGPGKVDKVAPATAAGERLLGRIGWGVGMLAGVVGVGMVLL